MAKPVLIYDGECGFCKRWVVRFHTITQSGFEYRPYQEAAKNYPDVPLADFTKAAQVFDSNKTRYSGADAMLFALSTGSGPQWPRRAYLALPGGRPVADFCYKHIARNRSFFSTIDRFLWGSHATPEPPEISKSRWTLGVLTGIAFISYGASFIPRWELLYGWYFWAILACLVGGALFMLSYGLKLRNWIRILSNVIIWLAAAAPLNALATFLFTRPNLSWHHWTLITSPTLLLVLFFALPLPQKLFRLFTKR